MRNASSVGTGTLLPGTKPVKQKKHPAKAAPSDTEAAQRGRKLAPDERDIIREAFGTAVVLSESLSMVDRKKFLYGLLLVAADEDNGGHISEANAVLVTYYSLFAPTASEPSEQPRSKTRRNTPAADLEDAINGALIFIRLLADRHAEELEENWP